MRIGSSTYSFKRLGEFITSEEEKRTIFSIIEEAPNYGLAGLELLAPHFESQSHEYVNQIKQRAVANGIDLYALSLENNFVDPNPDIRRQEVGSVLKWLDIAEQLGTPIVRVLGGRWGTADLSELMKCEGLEKPLPGHKYEEALEWVVESLKQCVSIAKEKGIILALENHWGITYSTESILGILEGVGSPCLKVALDCGNFRVNTYDHLQQLAPYAVLVHAKCYQGGGIYYDLDLDYKRIIRILKDAGYKGYLSIEFEGKVAPSIGIPAQVKILEESIRQS